jgi:hypothetical protein
MRVWLVFFAVMVAGCKDNAGTAPVPSASASPSVSAQASEPLDTHGKWWAVASKSRVFTEDRRVDADNAIRMLPPNKRDRVRKILDEMATQTADGDGITAASQIARDGQDRFEDVHNPATQNAITTAGLIVLHGLIAQACADHHDTAGLADIMAAIREMPLPHIEKSTGITERNVLEQEMRMAVDDKTMRNILAGAPPPKKSL